MLGWDFLALDLASLSVASLPSMCVVIVVRYGLYNVIAKVVVVGGGLAEVVVINVDGVEAICEAYNYPVLSLVM